MGVEMSHQTAAVAGVKDPANTFGEGVAGIDDARDVSENDVAGTFPVLNRKIVDINVSRALSGTAGIDHFYGRFSHCPRGG